MADTAVFSFLAEAIERETSFDRLEARGTVRLALEDAGLESHHVTSEQMKVVLETVMPAALQTRGVELDRPASAQGSR